MVVVGGLLGGFGAAVVGGVAAVVGVDALPAGAEPDGEAGPGAVPGLGPEAGALTVPAGVGPELTTGAGLPEGTGTAPPRSRSADRRHGPTPPS